MAAGPGISCRPALRILRLWLQNAKAQHPIDATVTPTARIRRFGAASVKRFMSCVEVDSQRVSVQAPGEFDRQLALLSSIGTQVRRAGVSPTAAQQAEEKAIEDRGTFDPRVISEGTIAYLITFDDGFRIVYRDSGGHVTIFERAAIGKLPGVDLALVAVSADFLNPLTEQLALEHMQLYRPDVYMPAHHDAGFSGHAPLWRATEPIFQALKDANPKLVTVSREYREPVCFDTEVNVVKSHGPR